MKNLGHGLALSLSLSPSLCFCFALNFDDFPGLGRNRLQDLYEGSSVVDFGSSTLELEWQDCRKPRAEANNEPDIIGTLDLGVMKDLLHSFTREFLSFRAAWTIIEENHLQISTSATPPDLRRQDVFHLQDFLALPPPPPPCCREDPIGTSSHRQLSFKIASLALPFSLLGVAAIAYLLWLLYKCRQARNFSGAPEQGAAMVGLWPFEDIGKDTVQGELVILQEKTRGNLQADTMTRPDIIRADSIDLQERQAPSAQEHSRSTPPPTGSLAPHQAETLREVKAEAAEEHLRSPRVSWSNGDASDLQQYVDDLSAGLANPLGIQQQEAGHRDQNGETGAGSAMAVGGQQQDALAIAQNGGVSGHRVREGDINGDAEGDDGMDDDMMDKISSSPSIEDEDIDFEFVYALHTFVATVEGQANATKGDTMVLLDDSNSYWWLVRVVKDSSIGYLPAEHIETPTERLARLNKHRNIDLSATMLGDQAEKTRNPLKSAIKRRKAKTVQFAGNVYIDYSDIEYSSDEEDADGEAPAQQLAQQEQQKPQAPQQTAGEPVSAATEVQDDTAKVEPLKMKGAPQKETKSVAKKQDAKTDADAPAAALVARTSEEVFDTKSAVGPKKTSDGTVRDSFFKDDTVETKKITLTPNLLRDDTASKAPNESKDVKQRPSLERLDKDVFKDDKKRKEKKEKDKKSGAIRSFFSRKDKKTKGEEEDDNLAKRSLDSASLDRDFGEEDSQGSLDKQPVQQSQQQSHQQQQQQQQAQQQSTSTTPQRTPSKLQKPQPRTEPSPIGKPGAPVPKEPGVDLATILSEGKINNVASVPPATMRIVEDDSSPQGSAQQKVRRNRPDDVVRNGDKAAMQRSAGIKNPPPQHAERLSDSPVQVSPVAANHPPPLMGDTSSQEEEEEDPSSVRSTPELIDHEDTDLMGAGRTSTKDSIATSTSTNGPMGGRNASWNDANLRAFFDSGSEIRDLLVVVYDKSDVSPVDDEDALVGSLFREQNAKLAEITTQLDNMLGDWLARKQRLRGTV
ncbi:hypothetical protein P8C59_004612 [Phyllachora maydis]|uniref:SH3 domain-containing protein n=1 Tax=Phyllachora maydis TaxID=1825666 RepID=A0AAD9MBG3_9PEZI|nr:hypothetical protein P8C59_004612 [Phyllachora maydis]